MSKQWLQAVPLPFAGVALAFGTLGNLFAATPPLRIFFGVISSAIFLLILAKIIFAFSKTRQELGNPVVAASFATFSMALMVLATYMPNSVGKFLWFLGIGVHFALLGYLLVRFGRKLRANLLAVYFIPAVGFVVASVTAPFFQAELFGQIIFWLGLVFYLLLLVPIISNHLLKESPNPLNPLKMIIAAPASLCLTGYLSSFSKINDGFLLILTLAAFLSTVWGYVLFFKLERKTFFPTFAAGTFPFVISAMAMKKLAGYAALQGWAVAGLINGISLVEIAVALICCTEMLMRYLHFLYSHSKMLAAEQTE